MKYALVNGIKTIATEGEIGFCPICGSKMVPHCGPIRIHHWKHEKRSSCDPWWENETEWHRSWKNHFPTKWQEVIQYADDGEKHIADVKTEQDWVIEFQHSNLKPKERRLRDAFYPKLIWVVDGMRRQRDKKQFQNIIERSLRINCIPTDHNKIYNLFFELREVRYPDECRLLAEWQSSTSLVFFDFHEPDSNLWFLLPEISNFTAYLMSISKKEFIDYHQDGRFEKLYNEQISPIRSMLIQPKQKTKPTFVPRNNVLSNRELRRRNRRL